MLQRIRKAMNEKEQGFTLIELLVVIIIIGILAAIAIPVFLNQRKKGVDASMKSDAKNAATAMETWLADNPTLTGPASTISVNPSNPVTNFLPGFRASKGNVVSVASSGGGYLVCVSNTNSSKGTATPNFIEYSSSAGGLMDGWGDCDA